MSLILDALRKSEAERRKAQASADVLAPPAHPPSTLLAGVPTWVWPVAVLLLLVVIAIWGMARTPTENDIETGQPNQHDAIAAEAAAPITETSGGSTSHGLSSDIARDAWHDTSTNPSTNSVPTPTAPPAQPGPGVASAMQGPIPNASSSPPSAATSAQAQAQAPASASASAPASASTSSAVASTSPKPTFPTSPASDNAPTVTAKATTPRLTQPSPAVTPTTNGPAPPAPAAPSPAAAASTVATAPTTRPAATHDPIRLADLGTADRQQLPPLKMSMHMWGPDADKRFAIIDGTRIGEGDRVGEAVVESIDQNGVVLVWNGYRLRVPVR